MNVNGVRYTFRPRPMGLWLILREGVEVGQVLGKMSDARAQAKQIERTYAEGQS